MGSNDALWRIRYKLNNSFKATCHVQLTGSKVFNHLNVTGFVYLSLLILQGPVWCETNAKPFAFLVNFFLI